MAKVNLKSNFKLCMHQFRFLRQVLTWWQIQGEDSARSLFYLLLYYTDKNFTYFFSNISAFLICNNLLRIQQKKWRLLQKFSFTNLKFVILVQQNSYLLIHRVSQVTLVLYISIHVTKRKIFSSRDCFERHNLWRCSLLYKKMFILKWSLTNFQAITMQENLKRMAKITLRYTLILKYRNVYN